MSLYCFDNDPIINVTKTSSGPDGDHWHYAIITKDRRHSGTVIGSGYKTLRRVRKVLRHPNRFVWTEVPFW